MILNCRQPDGKTVKIRLKAISGAPPVSVGRGKEATIQVDDVKCSRIHCAIRYWEDVFCIRDMNSSNGTFLNDKQIDIAYLRPGDKVRIGNTEFELEAEATGSEVTMVG